MTGQWGNVTVLLFAVVASGWLLRELEITAETREEARPSDRPDLIMEQLSMTAMDERGQPKRRLEAARMAHFPESASHRLEQPYLIMYQENQEPWHVQSEQGIITEDGDEIMLLGAVQIWRTANGEQPELEIETRDLRVLPEEDFGETDQAAIIKTRNSQSQGIGMRAFLKESRIQLLSEVLTIHGKAPH